MKPKTAFEILPCGSRAILVEFAEDANPAAVAAVARGRWERLAEAIPAERTLLLEWDDVRPVDAEVARVLEDAVAAEDGGPAGEIVEIPVTYDGDDLGAVATATGLSTEAVVALHSGADYEAAFCGFAPGFAYLTGLPRELWLPRLEIPRTRVPRGAVAVAAHYAGIYPSAMPGGWHLLGTTTLRTFDPTSSRPALLEPGTRVRFRP